VRFQEVIANAAAGSRGYAGDPEEMERQALGRLFNPRSGAVCHELEGEACQQWNELRRPVCAPPCAQVYETVATGEHVIVSS
jgi:hypothetical protein